MRRPIAALASTILAAAAHADFEIIGEAELATSSGQAYDITLDATSFYVAQIFTPEWDVFDPAFEYLTTTQAGAGQQFRAIGFSEQRATMFAADYPTGVIHELALDGTPIGSFAGAAPGQINAVAVDRLDATIWIATFDGDVLQYDPEGTLLASFEVPFFVTGLAIDEAAGTLLLMESLDDLVYEYDRAGNQVGIPVPIDIIPDNGLGLAYDAFTATLYATTQTGPARVTIFQDPDRPVLDDDEPCLADCNDDGELDMLDIVCFIQSWRREMEAGDCNADGLYDIFDFVCFQDALVEGCEYATYTPMRRPARAMCKRERRRR